MREILFKAKRLDNGEWFEGVPVDVTPLQCFGEPQKNKVVMVRAGFADWGMPRRLEYIKVDPETVCQYTGLSDKTGDKIFENDIMVFFNDDGESSNYVVQWHEHGWIICPEEGGSDDLDQFFAKRSIIVGNIHDKEEHYDS